MLEEWKNKIINDDCLNVLPSIPDKSIDCIICDLPYGTTACSWDTIIPFERLWESYTRIIKDNGAIVLFGCEPFSSYLRLSNLKWYKYDWIWKKSKSGSAFTAKYRPVNKHENISVFGRGVIKYIPQMTSGTPYKRTHKVTECHTNNHKIGFNQREIVTENEGVRYPKNLIKFNRDKDRFHPTQKPIALLEYLIKTYSNKGELILDNCSGSGTLAIACKRADRDFICIEKDKTYYDISLERLRKENMKKRLF